MNEQNTSVSTSSLNVWIIIISIIIPVAVAGLFFVKIDGYDFSFLPPIYATINGLTAAILVWALLAIKKGNIALHRKLMTTCLGFSAAFLVLYVVYHITSETTSFGGEGWIKGVYLFILASHILLSIIIIPFVLFTYLKGWLGEYHKHKKLARFTWPMWFYVAVTGVIVYLMISPYY
jgi:putative membrane protein